MKILITGGAGFIGSHLVDMLIEKNHEIIVYDNLNPQVHGNIVEPPNYLAKNITFIKNDIRNNNSFYEALKDTEVLFHLAALVGVGQSMYQVENYVDVNTLGTAKLLDILVNKENSIKKLVVASSMSTYGEGAYLCEQCGEISPKIRKLEQLKKKDWELNCPICGLKANPIPTNEEKLQDCQSIYALTKKEQEKMCLLVGKTYGINTTALRFFNVYGSRQSLSNPYTGICAIFSSRLLCGNKPIIYEDGKQTRDFIHVKDICQALFLSMKKSQAMNECFNVGTGQFTSILKVGETLSDLINPNLTPIITNEYRLGDIRHCVADISKISNKLGFMPEYSFEDGMKELIEWVRGQDGLAQDHTSKAIEELQMKGLLK